MKGDADIWFIINKLLTDEGYKVSELGMVKGRHDGQSVHPDLIALDVKLGDAYGRDICQRLLADAAISVIPMIIISASYGRHMIAEH